MFLLIKKTTNMVYFLLIQSTYKNCILYYKIVKATIYISNFAEAIFNIIVHHHSLPGLIVTNSNTFYTLKTWSCYAILQMSDTPILLRFTCETNGPIKRTNHTLEEYLQVFILFNNWVRLLHCKKYKYYLHAF